jgi:High potential iron-sulfur protein
MDRRAVVKSLAFTVCAVAVPAAAVHSAEAPHLQVKDPTAVALDYVENSSQVDLKKHPDYVPGSMCENCLQLQGVAGNNYRPCGLFPGKLVSVSGWCKGWTPEM